MVKERPTSNFQPPRNPEATLGVGDWELGVGEAYAACVRAARAHYENFPVASILLPRRMRPHVAAVYAFARAADDFADEGNLPAPERLRLIDGWEQRLHAAAESPQPEPNPVPEAVLREEPTPSGNPQGQGGA